MKLGFKHHGLQFFFVTLALEGRPQVLSHLDEDRAPVLTPYGEVVKEGLMALHKVFPAVTASDRVIMPDHVHFLIMVNYALAPHFNPLWASHILMDAIEEGWSKLTECTGDTPEPPDMVAVLAAALRRGRMVAHELRLRSALHGAPGGSGAEPPSVQFPPPPPLSPRFDRRCHLELSFDSRQLKAIRRYIRLNPARALWKLHHPDRFLRLPNARHPVLPTDRTWQAMGDLTLLSSPFLFHMRLSLRQTPAEHEPEIAAALAQAEQGMIPV